VTDEGQVAKHYASEGITARVLAALRAANGRDVPITADTLAPIDHFHGKGVVATEELAAVLQPKASDRLLDIGCGIGGPARWIAAKYGCPVTGVDLTAEFCGARTQQPVGACRPCADPARLGPLASPARQ
jgi:sarcosine/dimethylglycine N-methyltransferase